MERGRHLRTSSRSSEVALDRDAVRAVVASGRRGPQWYVDAPPLVARGALDRLLGGRPRVEPPGHELLLTGDEAGLWTVADSTPDELVLRALVKAPGEVMLRTTMTPAGPRRTRVEQSVTFIPSGVLGHAYLLADLPAREVVIELTHRHLLAVLRRAAT